MGESDYKHKIKFKCKVKCWAFRRAPSVLANATSKEIKKGSRS